MDDERRTDQPADDPTPDGDTPDAAAVPTARNMFSPEPEAERESARAARRMAAIWGLGTGAVMAIILGLCVLLLYLASTTA